MIDWKSSSPQKTFDDAMESTVDIELQGQEGVAATYAGVEIVFQDISVSVKGNKKILDEVNGYIPRGSLTALMGPSGSGKTTLVDVLTFRKNTGKRSGTVTYDGQKPAANFMRYAVAYVQQEDALIENLTVIETMRYNYDLITGGRHRRGDGRVDAILQQLALDGCRDVLVGNAFQRGISGGQRKRVNIACSLLRDPSVLVLDEPTSGLDSFTAYEVISAVKSLSTAGLTVLSTIHAPSTSVFHLFDRLLVLLDGRMVYSGDVASNSIFGFFRDCSLAAPPADDQIHNAADWLTSVVVQTSRINQSEALADHYEASSQRQEVEEYIEKATAMHEAAAGHPPRTLPATSGNLTLLQRTGIHPTWTIIKHRMLADYKNVNFVIPRIGEKILFAVVILTLYWNIGKPMDPEAAIDTASSLAKPIQITTALFMWSTLPVFGSVAVIPSIFNERVLFNREREAGYYNSGSYLFAKVFEEAVINLFTSGVLAVAVWFALALSGQFPLFWMVYFVTSLVGVTVSYLGATIAPNTEYAIIAVSGLNVVLLFFVGLLIRLDDIPSYWVWLVDINHLHYAWGACVKNQFTQEDTFLGVSVLEYFSLDNSVSAWVYLVYEMCFVVVFFLAGMLSLRFVNFSKR
jgi:ATP-binding cassette subfamily G (WHITE) protein 2